MSEEEMSDHEYSDPEDFVDDITDEGNQFRMHSHTSIFYVFQSYWKTCYRRDHR